MHTVSNQSYSNQTSEGYPVLHLGYADVVLLGKWNGLSNALYSLHKNGSFWVQYDAEDALIESYTLIKWSRRNGIRRKAPSIGNRGDN